jgi:DNA repair photolyase
MSSPRITGTKEWSVASVNVVLGCPHRCRYCYARARAVRFGQCPSIEAWGTTYHQVRDAEVRKRRAKAAGAIMFPSTHDITPEHLDACLGVLEKLLRAGNRVLVVSKPHTDCILQLCRDLRPWREQILFRFTIGALSDKILGYWEPGAPPFAARLNALKLAHYADFATSVSCEPLLEPERARDLVDRLAPYCTDSIWIGKLNQLDQRVEPGTDPAEIERIRRGQTDEAVRHVYAQLRDHPLVRWKESYKQVLGLELADRPGLDR